MKHNRLLIAATGLLLLLGVIGSWWVMRTPTDQRMVEIVRDGAVLYQLDLTQEDDRAFVVEYEGRTNTIEIRDHQIRVLDAECSDQTCVHMGWLGDSGLPIVCLPNHLVIQYASAADGLDAVA